MIFCFPNVNIATAPIVMLMRPNLPNAAHVNTIIRRYFEAGLLQKGTTQRSHNHHQDPPGMVSFEVVVLNMEHLSGGGLSFVVGMSLAGLLCVVECWLHRYVSASGTHQLWFLLQFERLVIDPERNAFNAAWAPGGTRGRTKYEEPLYPFLN